MRTFSLTHRIAAGTLAITLLGVGAMAAVGYRLARTTVESMARAELDGLTVATSNMVKQVTTAAVVNHLKAVAQKNREIVVYFHHLAETGVMTDAAAQRAAQGVLLSQTIGHSGYIYCLSSQGVLKVHPKAALVGANISQHGFAQEQLRRKEGYLEYMWQNPGDEKALPKALYMTYFEPWDWIISASSYRSEFSSLVDIELFREDVKAVTVGDSGYMYVMDSKGTLLVHPQLEGQNISDARDSTGRAYIQEMCRNKNGSIVYSWQNPDEDAPREKLVAYRYVEEFDWIIAGGAYTDVLYAPLRKVRASVLLVLLATSGIAVLFSLLFGRAMGRRFSVLEGVAARVAQGDLRGAGSIATDVHDAATPREILSVEHAFHGMARSLGRVVHGIAGMSREIAGSVGTVEGNAQAMVDASQLQLAAVTHVVQNLERVSAAALKVDVNMVQLDSAAEQGSAATSQLSRSLDAILVEVDQFSTFVEETHQAIKQMSSLATDIQSHTSALSGAVESSLASSGEVARSIRSIDETTKESVRVTQSVAQRAHAGQDAVSRSIQGMSNIAVTFQAIDSAVTSLGQRVDAIEDIVQVIEAISKQTMLLALNAAIVAAQAGEHGRGFSVMADEIKRLADRTDDATGEIAGLIGSVKQERQRTLTAMAAGLQTVQDGHTLAGEAGQAIASILDLTQQSQARAAETAAATREQVVGHKTIMDSVARIAEMNHGVLELTTRQHAFVGNITRGIDAALASLSTVRGRIQEEAHDSKVVAQQINTISRMSTSVRQDSSQQHAASTAVVRDIEVIKDSASQILARSERVAGSLVALTERITSLKAAVGHFTTGPEHTTAPHRV